MKKIQTNFSELFIIKHNIIKDNRGFFVKTYNENIFKKMDLKLSIKERYISVSHKNVIRGMHFQTPPMDHIKLVNVIQGSILDVVLDIRNRSETYGEFFKLHIKAKDGITLHIPKGFAHGFKALESNTIIEYNQTSEYSQNNDNGIKYNSFGFNWGLNKPILSERDLHFQSFINFKSPFV
jgi:dTDP-4-dehydrorhamnose 3,5-epimerase